MNILLDTHAVIWYSMAAERLTGRVLAAIDSTSNAIYLSQVSIWEMQIKQSIGKLELPVSVREFVEFQIANNDFTLLQIHNEALWQLESLPRIHRDPFDRLLVCQAQCDDLTLITADRHIPKHDVATLW